MTQFWNHSAQSTEVGIGWAKAEDYALFKEKLDKVREQFLDHLSEIEEDRPKWLSAWSFKD